MLARGSAQVRERNFSGRRPGADWLCQCSLPAKPTGYRVSLHLPAAGDSHPRGECAPILAPPGLADRA